MYQLIIEENGVEYVAYTCERQREASLMLQRHLRSLTRGTAFIRESEDNAKK